MNMCLVYPMNFINDWHGWKKLYYKFVGNLIRDKKMKYFIFWFI